jgi:hypothetical protein
MGSSAITVWLEIMASPLGQMRIGSPGKHASAADHDATRLRRSDQSMRTTSMARRTYDIALRKAVSKAHKANERHC